VTGEPPVRPGNAISGGEFGGPVFQAAGDVHAAFGQLPAAVPVALAQLPPQAGVFAGRDDDLAVLAGLLDPAGGYGAVLVSAVAGLAGVGKTTLAVRAGHAAVRSGWFGGGVLFIDLHGYDDTSVEPGQALDALLRALGVPAEHIPPGAEERAGLYRSALAQVSDPVLVIADNASSEAQVKPLLPGSGPHKVLVTSRHTLAGLGARLVDVTVLDEEAAVGLLDAALLAARPEDDRISSDRKAAGRLAGLCGGLPLALQITAALLKADPTLSAGSLADDLAAESEQLAQLAYNDGSGTAGLSVAASFELSYQRLEGVPARVFRLLPVNPGPDVSTAAAAVLADLPVSQARRMLADLARAHLIEASPGTVGRWRMHDLVLLYARRLSDSGADADGREQARDRLLGYYLDMADAACGHLRALPVKTMPHTFSGRDDALAWLDAERACLTAAIQMAVGTSRDNAAVRLPIVLAEYLVDWRQRFDEALAAATISRDTARLLGDRGNETVALSILGIALRELRRFEEAITAHQDALAIFRQTGNRCREGMTLDNLGIVLREARRFEEAITAHQDALAIFRQSGDQHSEGMTLGNLGNDLEEVHRFEEAITAHQDALAIFRQTGDRRGEGMALFNLGSALQQAGQLEEAITACQDAAAICRDVGDRRGEGMAACNLGGALAGLGRYEEAITAYKRDIAICRDIGDRHGEGITLDSLGTVLQELGRYEEAITAHEEALAIYRETNDHHGEGTALRNLERAQAARQV
jgi:tetratricopeptide (TPR) repeat protein